MPESEKYLCWYQESRKMSLPAVSQAEEIFSLSGSTLAFAHGADLLVHYSASLEVSLSES